jgi:hypothetical protein
MRDVITKNRERKTERKGKNRLGIREYNKGNINRR